MRTDSTDFSTIRTICPPAIELHVPTVRDVVGSPEVLAGRPEVLAGYDGLDRSIRWVHVMEGPTVEGMLSGQELVLSTGVGWPAETELQDYVAGLVDAGVAGLVLELGSRYPAVPTRLVRACQDFGLPLIALHRRVRFVSITEAVHRRILAGQMDALRARDEVHALFTELIRHGAPADHIVHEVARLLRRPVVLEDLSHRMVAYSLFGADPASLPADWRDRSRIAHGRGNPDRSVAVVEARGKRWGCLVAVDEPGHTEREHTGGADFVLSQAAVALSLDRATGHGADEWLELSHQQLLDDVVQRRISGTDTVAHRFEATGMPLRDRHLVGITLRPRRPRDGRTGPVEAPGARAAAVSAARSMGAEVVCSPVSAGAPLFLAALSVSRRHADANACVDGFADRLAGDPGVLLDVAAGSVATDVQGLLVSLDEGIELLNLADASRNPTSGPVVRADGQELPLLLSRLRGEPRVQEYVERVLGPLLAHDARHGTDLLDVLTAYLQTPTNRIRAAANSHLSRSVFYQRIAAIEKLLGRSLEDGHTIASLYCAALACRQMRTV